MEEGAEATTAVVTEGNSTRNKLKMKQKRQPYLSLGQEVTALMMLIFYFQVRTLEKKPSNNYQQWISDVMT